jgi:hypothetical protein
MNRIRPAPILKECSANVCQEIVPKRYRSHHSIGDRAGHRHAVGTGVGYIDPAAVGEICRLSRVCNY